MSIHRDIMNACQGRDTDDALSAIRRQYGSHTTHFIAQQAGLSDRQALRYAKGEVKNMNPDVIRAIEDSATEGMYAADALAEATFIDCGTIEVEYNGESAGTRNVGRLSVTGEMRDLMEQAGQCYADGDDGAGDRLMSEAIMGGYCQSKGGGFEDLIGTLDVSAFRGGFRLT